MVKAKKIRSQTLAKLQLRKDICGDRQETDGK